MVVKVSVTEKKRRELYYQKNHERIRNYARNYASKNKERVELLKKLWKQDLRKTVLLHYSPKLVCTCCGESTYQFLTIDHINGKTKNRNDDSNKSGNSLYLYLRRNNYPVGFQVLCFNCNCAKGIHGACPHQAKPDFHI